MKIIIGILLCIPFLFFSGARIYKNINYGIECDGHLKRAADTNTVNLAKQEMNIALKYIESHGMKVGYTSVLYNTPSEDVGFWYQNLSSSLKELNEVTDNSSQLEKSNILMKLRETLLDSGEKGHSITQPTGISIFPNNFAYMIWGWLSTIFMLVGIVFVMVGVDE